MEKNINLASGFGKVDQAGEAELFQNCLRRANARPYMQCYKSRSFELLQLAPGLSVLDVGCGLGDDCLAMSKIVSPGGRIVGIDASEKMIASARAAAISIPAVEFRQCEAERLPFEDGSFDRVRVDRTLQHCPNPITVLQEMARVTKIGGLIFAYDNDWGTFTVNAAKSALTELVTKRWTDSFQSPWIGRYLKSLFLSLGCREVEMHPSVSTVESLELAEALYDFKKVLGSLVDGGDVSSSDADGWYDQLSALDRSGRLLCSLTAFSVIGRK
jgi:ubiquinone/menaquinone biosynthesis C-methylase UbiE